MSRSASPVRDLLLLFALFALPATAAAPVPATLSGGEAPDIVLLEPPDSAWTGAPRDSASDKAQAVYGRERIAKGQQAVRKVYVGAQWDFSPEGSFRVTPPPGADVREDLFPFSGHWSPSGNLLEIHAERHSPLGAGLSLDGTLRFSGGRWHLDALFSVVSGGSRRIAWLRQSLSEGEPASNPPPSDLSPALTGAVAVSSGSEAEPTFSEPRFGGTWTWEDGTGRGELKVAPEGTGWSASLDRQGALLRLHGSAKGDRLELSTEPEGAKLFLRALAGGEFLAGYWRSPGEDGIKPALARLRPPSIEVTPAVTAADADALRLLGGDLASRGSCAAARSPLLAAIAFYRKEIPAIRGTQERLGLSASLALATQWLLACDLNLKDGPALLADLKPSLEGLRLLRSDDWARSELRDRSADLQGPLTFYQGLLDSLSQGIAAIDAQPGGSPSSEFEPTRSAVETALTTARGALSAQLDELSRLTDASRDPKAARKQLEALPAALRETTERAGNSLDQATTALAGKDEAVFARYQALRIPDGAEPGTQPVAPEALDALESSLIEALRKSPHLTSSEKHLLLGAKKSRLALDGLRQILRITSRDQSDVSGLMVDSALALARAPERFLANALTDEDKRQALQDLKSTFDDLVFFLLDDGHPGPALAVAEAARSRAFLDLLASREEVRAGLEDYFRQTGTVTVLPNPMHAESPNLDDLQKIVDQRGGVTVEYFQGRDRLAIFAISPHGEVEAVAVPCDAGALRTLVEALQDRLENRSRQGFGDLTRELHRWLIEPLPRGFLPEDPEVPVTLIPYEDLLRVPFALLEDEDGKMLIERHALVYSPSIAVLRYTRENRSRRPSLGKPSLLALVNPSPMPLRNPEATYPSLSETEAWLPKLLRFYPGGATVWSGGQATKKALLDSTQTVSVLQLVTHAQLNPGAGGLLASHIALSAGAEPESGYLRVPEVFQLRLHADFVILWACQTGLGSLSPDGVDGFTRAFTWAGASSLIASLWSIPQDDSFRVMYAFHEAWRTRGRNRAQALRDAFLEVAGTAREEPWRWGAFVLYGEPE